MARKENRALEIRIKFIEITDEEIEERLESIADALLTSATREPSVPNVS